MSDFINEIQSDGIIENKPEFILQTNAPKGSLLNPKESSLGMHVVLIRESEHLGPQAYNADDAGIKAFQMHNYAYTWGSDQSFETMEGHISKKSPDKIHVLLGLYSGEFWFKIVKAEWEFVQEEVKLERAELKEKMYLRGVEMKFHALLKALRRKNELEKEQLADERVTRSEQKKIDRTPPVNDEAAPPNINPKKIEKNSLDH